MIFLRISFHHVCNTDFIIQTDIMIAKYVKKKIKINIYIRLFQRFKTQSCKKESRENIFAEFDFIPFLNFTEKLCSSFDSYLYVRWLILYVISIYVYMFLIVFFFLFFSHFSLLFDFVWEFMICMYLYHLLKEEIKYELIKNTE